MSDHEDLCAITLGYNHHCTCIRYAEQTTCPWCKAVV